MPVGRVNERNPLGHSGHLKLHEVVGSKDNATGYPQLTVLLVHLEK